MGERQGWLFEPTFNRSIKLRQADSRLSDNAGALLLREFDHRLGFTADLAARLTDPRDPARTRYQQVELLRQHLYALALGHVRQDDHDLLAHDPGVKLAVWDRPGQGVLNERLASQPSDWRLMNRLSAKAHRAALREALSESVGRHQRAALAGSSLDQFIVGKAWAQGNGVEQDPDEGLRWMKVAAYDPAKAAKPAMTGDILLDQANASSIQQSRQAGASLVSKHLQDTP